MFARSILLLSLALGTVAGCSREGASSREGTSSRSTPGDRQSTTDRGHAPAGVKPGSHEDWCEEHQVPESQCTRCNPDLIPAFKATNDWCAEHSLPESQCKLCNPEIEIKRPPRGS